MGNGKAFFLNTPIIFNAPGFFPHGGTSRLNGALYYERYEHFETHVSSCCESDKITGRVTRRPGRFSALSDSNLHVTDYMYIVRNCYKESLNRHKRKFFSTTGFLKSCSFRGTRLLLYQYTLYLLSFSLSDFFKSSVCVSYCELRGDHLSRNTD